MQIPLRSIVGCGAGATSMALVLFAGFTAARPEPAPHMTSACRDASQKIPLPAPPVEAQKPA